MNKLKNVTVKKQSRLGKKPGIDKLVISLVLIAIGIVACYAYKTHMLSFLDSAFDQFSNSFKSIFG